MRQAQERIEQPSVQQSLPKWLDASSCQSASMLLPAIKDQQIYQCLASSFLTLARQAGAPLHALRQVASSLFAARGLDSSNMLQNLNQNQSQYRQRRHCYNVLQKGVSTAEMKNLLEKMEKEMVDARSKQKQYRCLQKYRKEKEEEIAPSITHGSTSKKDRFKKIIRNKYAKRSIQSSNFYQFDATEILQNTFKAENQCYKTLSSFVYLKTMYGHSTDQDIESYSPVYNAIFDRSENFIITSGQEGLIKVWHKGTGTLVKNLKGHTDFLNKIDTSKCNKYLLSCGGDGVRFFDMKSLKPLGGWRTNSIDEITSFLDEDGKSVFLFGQNSELYLLTEDVMLASANRRLSLQDFMIFTFSELVGKQNSAILVISLSPQKTHLLIGLENGQFMLIYMSTIQQIMRTGVRGEKLVLPALDPIRAHYQQIIEIKWSENSTLWATGSKDGRCCLWELRGDQIVLINTLMVNKGQKGRKKRNFSCTYICWNCTFTHFAAGFQENVDEEDTQRGQGEVLVYSLKDRRVTCELSRDVSLSVSGIRAMDSHPHYANILLICQAEGHVILLDLFLGCIVNVFEERGYHILHPQFCLIPTECRFTQDGLYFVVSSEYGSISLYGYDSKMFYALAPSQQFLTTDFTEIQIQQNTMKALPLTLDFNDDINNYPIDSICTIKGQPYQNIIKINPDQLLFALNNSIEPSNHLPQIRIDDSFLAKMSYSLREGALLDLSYQKTYEEIENSKQVTLFHERERQFSKISNLTANKIDSLKASHNVTLESQNMDLIEEDEPIVRTRKLKRHAQLQRVNYADDFSYHDSQEEDFNLIEQELPEEVEEDSESEQEEEEPRLRRRERTRIRRQTRQAHSTRYQQPDVMESNESRMPTRSRNNVHHRQEVDDISESIPKKKIKHDNEQDQSQQPKKYSRLRKHAHSEQLEEPIDCYRCQFVKATQMCEKCNFTQQYCEACSIIRGRRLKQKFKCIICLFLQNEASEDYEHVNEEIYRATAPSKQLYIPQLEDEVRFFFQGYEQFLIQNVDKLNNDIVKTNPEFRLLPHTEDLQLLNVPSCKVKSIDFYLPVKGSNFANNAKRNPGKGEPTPILMLLGLVRQGQVVIEKVEQIAEVKEQIQEQNLQKKVEDNIFWIFYIPGFDFLIPESLYSQILQKDLVSKFVNNQLIQIKDEQMQIVEISPFEDRYPESIWKLIKIRKTEGKRLRGNTKQIQRRINVWKVSEEIESIEEETKIDPKHTQRLIVQIEKWMHEDSPFCIFIDYVDFEIYPLYRQQIPVGMCLQTILERLKNSYYHSYESLKADFDRIYDNSLAFNGESHNVTQSAFELKNILYSLISEQDQSPIDQLQPQPQEQLHLQMHSQAQPLSHSKKTQEQSNSKKEKKKRESQEYLDPGYTVTERRRTRKDNHNHNRIKRRRDSSDYEESEQSLDDGLGVSTRGGRTKHPQGEAKRITRSRTKPL